MSSSTPDDLIAGLSTSVGTLVRLWLLSTFLKPGSLSSLGPRSSYQRGTTARAIEGNLPWTLTFTVSRTFQCVPRLCNF